jgi:hypothetical protein
MTVRKLGVVLAGVLAIAGCGDDDSDSPPAASAPGAAPATAAATATAPAPAATTPKTKPKTTTATGPSAGKSTRKPVAPGGKNDGPKTTYSGNGSKALPLELERNAVLRWTVTGGTRFRLGDPSGRLKISGGARGQTFAQAGTYPRARVTADGKWRLKIELLAAP